MRSATSATTVSCTTILAATSLRLSSSKSSKFNSKIFCASHSRPQACCVQLLNCKVILLKETARTVQIRSDAFILFSWAKERHLEFRRSIYSDVITRPFTDVLKDVARVTFVSKFFLQKLTIDSDFFSFLQAPISLCTVALFSPPTCFTSPFLCPAIP